MGRKARRSADLPLRAAPPPAFVAVPVFTWTGTYFGVNAGYVDTDVRTNTYSIGRDGTLNSPKTSFPVPLSVKSNSGGFIGGA